VAFNCRFFIRSTDSANGRYSTLRRADREALALEIGQRLDAAVGGGDDLDVVRIDRPDGAQLVHLGLEAGLLVAVPGGFERIAQRKGDLAAALLQQDQIFHRRLGGLYLGLHVGNLVAVDLSDSDPERIVDTGCATGQHVNECLGPRRRRSHNRSRGDGRGNQLRNHR
jgi:hypothetical protein